MMKQVSTRQRRLSALLRTTKGPIRIDDAMAVLGLEREHASKLLAGWHEQGAIRRVSHGLYVPVSPNALGQTQVLDDPWILVPELYAPAYIGGWSALEHWELTEQLFRTVCVLTNKRTTYGKRKHQGVSFFIKYIPEKRLFGTKTIWRNDTKMQISDPHKTMLDIIDEPYIGAGLQHSIDCLGEYKILFAKQSGLDQLLEYAIQIDNGALFKKLGFLGEKLEFDASFIDECAKRLTTGYAFLDKSAKDNKLVTRWRLWVPMGYEF